MKEEGEERWRVAEGKDPRREGEGNEERREGNERKKKRGSQGPRTTKKRRRTTVKRRQAGRQADGLPKPCTVYGTVPYTVYQYLKKHYVGMLWGSKEKRCEYGLAQVSNLKSIFS